MESCGCPAEPGLKPLAATVYPPLLTRALPVFGSQES